MKQENDDKCLDDFPFVRVSDDEVKDYMRTCGIPNSSQLQHLKRAERDAFLAELKTIEGVTLSQLARITGISKSVIQRVGR